MATNRRRLFGLVAGAVGVLGLASYGVVQWQERAGRAADGGARLTVAAARPDGTAPSSKEFDRTKDLLMTRLKAAQLKQPHVDISADNRLVLRAGGEATGEMLRGLAASGRAQIRKVAAAVKLDGATSTGSPLPAVPETRPHAGFFRSWRDFTRAAAIGRID